MFSNSTQKRYWLFKDESYVHNLRSDAIQSYILKYTEKYQGFIEILDEVFLTHKEENDLHLFYSKKLWDFCTICFYDVPRSVVEMAFNYYKRFYLITSAMDFHPKEVLITCLFLACKVDEYNITLPKFLKNIKGDVKKLAEVIISHEMKIIEHLQFQMIIHTPYRPLEGFFIDLKTRFPSLRDADKLRIGAHMFLDALTFTNATFLFTPSQIALTSLVHSSKIIGENLDKYINLLFEHGTLEDKFVLQNAIEKIELLHQSSIFLHPDEFAAIDKDPKYPQIEAKLEKCRNPENNPITPEFAQKIRYETGIDEIINFE